MLGILATFAFAQPSSTPTPDAEIVRWDQHWALAADGSLVFHERKHVRLNHERANGDFADPRITYNADTQKVEVLAARVKRPDGKFVDLPPYARTEVAPFASSGWPAFANIHQIVLVLSGVEPGCIAELEYKVTTKPTDRPWLAADLRLQDRYPVSSRTIRVDLPRGVELSPVLLNMDEQRAPYAFQQSADGSVSHRWDLARCSAQPDEPFAAPWQERVGRLAFGTAGTPVDWLKPRLDTLSGVAEPSPAIAKSAADWSKDQTNPSDKIRAIQEKFAATFNFVDFDTAWQPPLPRPAGAVFECHYGLPAEAAAVLLSLARAASLTAQPAVIVNDSVWVEEAPQNGLVAAYVVQIEGPERTEIWHAQSGRVTRDKRWNGHTVLSLRQAEVARTPLPPFTSADESQCRASGRLTIAEDATFSGTVDLRTSGLFLSPDALRNNDAQKARVSDLIRRVFPAADVTGFTVRSLSPSGFEATAQVKSSKPLEKIGSAYRLLLAQDGPAMADVSLPLNYARLESPIRLAGAFAETLEITIAFPSKWSVDAGLGSLAAVSGDWGSAAQSVRSEPGSISLSRQIRIASRDLTASQITDARKTLNDLRAESARTILLRP